MQLLRRLELESRAQRHLQLAQMLAGGVSRQGLGEHFSVVEPEPRVLRQTGQRPLETAARRSEVAQSVVQNAQVAVETAVERAVEGGVNVENLLIVQQSEREVAQSELAASQKRQSRDVVGGPVAAEGDNLLVIASIEFKIGLQQLVVHEEGIVLRVL